MFDQIAGLKKAGISYILTVAVGGKLIDGKK